jgi:hypothetical protein
MTIHQEWKAIPDGPDKPSFRAYCEARLAELGHAEQTTQRAARHGLGGDNKFTTADIIYRPRPLPPNPQVSVEFVVELLIKCEPDDGDTEKSLLNSIEDSIRDAVLGALSERGIFSGELLDRNIHSFLADLASWDDHHPQRPH